MSEIFVPDAEGDLREAKLHELRREAERNGRVARQGIRAAGAPLPPNARVDARVDARASAENGYYGVPLLKVPAWTWEIPVYFFTGGFAGAAAGIAGISKLCARGRTPGARRENARGDWRTHFAGAADRRSGHAFSLPEHASRIQVSKSHVRRGVDTFCVFEHQFGIGVPRFFEAAKWKWRGTFSAGDRKRGGFFLGDFRSGPCHVYRRVDWRDGSSRVE